MSRTLHLTPGDHWFAGVDLPFVVPQSLVSGACEDLGFRDITWHDREDASPPVDPREDPLYSDEWDTWGEGLYTGAERDYVLKYNVPWIVKLASSRPPPATPPSSSAPPELTLQEKAAGIVKIALESRDPVSMRAAAMMVRGAGFQNLAVELEAEASRAEAGDDDPDDTSEDSIEDEVDTSEGSSEDATELATKVATEVAQSVRAMPRGAAAAIVLDVLASVAAVYFARRIWPKRSSR